jgi:hypothetical protein
MADILQQDITDILQQDITDILQQDITDILQQDILRRYAGCTVQIWRTVRVSPYGWRRRQT